MLEWMRWTSLRAGSKRITVNKRWPIASRVTASRAAQMRCGWPAPRNASASAAKSASPRGRRDAMRSRACGRAHPERLEQGVNRLVHRRRDAEFARHPDDAAGEPVELETIAAFEVVRHRGLEAGLC